MTARSRALTARATDSPETAGRPNPNDRKAGMADCPNKTRSTATRAAITTAATRRPACPRSLASAWASPWNSTKTMARPTRSSPTAPERVAMADRYPGWAGSCDAPADLADQPPEPSQGWLAVGAAVLLYRTSHLSVFHPLRPPWTATSLPRLQST